MQINLSSVQKNNTIDSIKQEFWRDRYIYGYVLITSFIVYIVKSFLSQEINYNLNTYLSMLASACYVTFLVWCCYYYGHLISIRETHPTRSFIYKIKSLATPVYKPISFIFFMLALNLSFSVYTYMKSIIPLINPFYLDFVFIKLDEFIHFGYPPWELTHLLFPSKWSSFIINILYNLWFFFMWSITLFFVCYKKNEHLRNQFLLTFLSSWFIIGGIIATLLSSAGPAFLFSLTNNEYYLPLMDRLNSQSGQLVEIVSLPLWALDTQDMLWSYYQVSSQEVGSGISAMPSMHVAIAVLMAMSIYSLNKRFGYVAWLYALSIQIGSVHLGWHYAVDGYFAAICVVILWKTIGLLLVKFTQIDKRHANELMS